MSGVEALLDEFEDRGIRLVLEGEGLRYLAPKGAVTEADIARIRQMKDGLVRYLGEIRDWIDRYYAETSVPPAGELKPMTIEQDDYRQVYIHDDIEKLQAGPQARLLILLPLAEGVDLDRLEESFAQFCRQCSDLRSRIVEIDGRFAQVADPYRGFRLKRFELSGDGADFAEAAEAALDALLAADNYRLFNAVAVSLEGGCRVVAIGVSHFIADGWSTRLIPAYLSQIYARLSRGDSPALEELVLQYGDYAVRQRGDAYKAGLVDDVLYWRRALSGFKAVPLPRARPDAARGAMTFIDSAIGGETFERVDELGRSEGVNFATTLLACYVLALAVWSGETDITSISLFHGRSEKELEGMVGVLPRRLPVRTRLSEGQTLREALHAVAKSQLQAWKHSRLPAQAIVDILGLPTTVMQIVFNDLTDHESFRAPDYEGLFDIAPADGTRVRLGAVERLFYGRQRLERRDMEFYFFMARRAASADIRIGYSGRFAAEDVEAFLALYRKVISAMASRPDTRISELRREAARA